MSHFFFIAAAYGATAVVFAGLVAWLVLDGRARRRELAALEKAGARRRGANMVLHSGMLRCPCAHMKRGRYTHIVAN